MTRFFAPSEKLSSYVKEYWVWESVNTKDLPWILPSYGPELVFHLGTPPRVCFDESPQIQLTNVHWVGPQTRRWKLESDFPVQVVSVRFLPGAIYECYSIKGNELTDSFFSAEKYFRGTDIHSFRQDLSVTDKANIPETLNLFLTKNLQNKEDIPPYIRFALIRLMKEPEKITDLANRLQISRKQLDRKFKEVYGLSPKDFRKIHRLLSMIRNPIHYKSRNEHSKLTELAHHFDYSDQSHLIHDFKNISGVLPKEWFDLYEKMSHFYNSDP